MKAKVDITPVLTTIIYKTKLFIDNDINNNVPNRHTWS